MSIGFFNSVLLLGLVSTIIPVLIHLFSRRRYDVVDWGAMQFLQVSETTRRRLLLEDVLLMLLRMGLIAVMVMALAAPWVRSDWLTHLGTRPNRDVVLVLDGSYSMSFHASGTSAHDAAKQWVGEFLDALAPGDSAAVLQAKQQTVHVLEPTHDFQRVRAAIAALPAPRGGCDWPQAVQAALKQLHQSQRPQREIILLTDGQRYGWADEVTLLRWELLAPQLRQQAAAPRLWVVNLDPHRPANPANWSLAPLRVSRAVASVGQQVTFRTALQLHGQTAYRPPHRLHLEIDGRHVTDLKPPAAARLEKGQVPFSFSHRFVTPGSHLVTVIVEPDPPPEQRPANYAIRDHLPGDNRQDFALEVLSALPVLLVDGDMRPSPRTRGTDFLRDALSPARDRTPAVVARVVPVQQFDADALRRDLGKEPGSRPRVLVLANVPRLTPPQYDAVTQFLADGGGVLVTLGDRVEPTHYNEALFRGGQGWLPARLDGMAGNEGELERAASPLATSFFHPALDLFREMSPGNLADARFPRWWKMSTPGRHAIAVPVALLTSNDPFLVERSYRAGRVLLCTVPLDSSWRTNLPQLPAFAPLAHELVYYLAGVRGAELNLQPGQPLRYRPSGAVPSTLTVRPPEGLSVPLDMTRRPAVFEQTHEPGVYRVEAQSRPPNYFVVQADPRESDLTPCSAEDRAKVGTFVPATYVEDAGQLTASLTASAADQELWWWLMLGVVALLCGEVWLTRRRTAA